MIVKGLTPIKVEDAVFYVRMSWKTYRDIAKQQSELKEEENLEFMERVVKQVVVRVEGLVDETGNTVNWSPDLFDELSPLQVAALSKAIFSIGTDNSMDPTTGM